MTPTIPPTTVAVDGSAIREVRVRAGLDARDVAERVGITRSHLYMVERGHRPRMRPSNFESLRRVLGVDREELLAKSGVA